jgi:hypothetical protein
MTHTALALMWAMPSVLGILAIVIFIPLATLSFISFVRKKTGMELALGRQQGGQNLTRKGAAEADACIPGPTLSLAPDCSHLKD